MFFKKKKRYSDYTIDLGKLKSKGIISEPAEDTASNTATGSSGLGFLGNLASASTTSDSEIGNEPLFGNVDERDLPLSLRDKIRTISEKLYRIADRIDLLEHKINRIERKVGIKEEI